MNDFVFDLPMAGTLAGTWEDDVLKSISIVQGLPQTFEAPTDDLSYLLQEEKSIDNATQKLINLIFDNPSHQNICLREDNENKRLSICFKNPYKIQSEAFMGALANVLSIHDLDKIEFICCRFEDIVVWNAFFNQAEVVLKSIRLSFVDCSIGEEHLVVLNNHKYKIISLTLENQSLNNFQIEKLSIFLENNLTIKELFVCGNELESYDFLGYSLKGCVSLEVLDLTDNELDDNAAAVVVTAVTSLLNFKRLLLKNNQISNLGVQTIIDKLKEHPSEIRLDIDQKPSSDEGENKGVKRKRETSQKDLENSIQNKKERHEWNEFLNEMKLILFDGEQILYDQEKYGELVKDLKLASHPSEELLNRILLVEEAESQEFFFEILLSKEFEIVPILGDGDCLFASIGTGLERSNPFIRFFILEYAKRYKAAFKDYDFNILPIHHCLRLMTVHYISIHQQEFGDFISDDEIRQGKEEIIDDNRKVEIYVNKMKQLGMWGGDCEIKALLNIFKKMHVKRSIKIFDVNKHPTFEEGELQTPKMLYRTTSKNDLECIYLLRKNQNHYQLLIKKSSNELIREGNQENL